MSFQLYARSIEGFVSGEQDWDSDVHYLALLESTYVPDKINHFMWAHVASHEISSPEYQAQQMSGQTVMIDSDDAVICDADDVEFGYQSTLQAAALVIVRGDPMAKSPSDPLVGFMEFGPIAITNRPLAVRWDTVFRIWDGCDCSHVAAFVKIDTSDLIISSHTASAHAGAGASPGLSDLVINAFAAEVQSGAMPHLGYSDLVISSNPAEAIVGTFASAGMSDLIITPLEVTAHATTGVQYTSGDFIAQYSLTVNGIKLIDEPPIYEESGYSKVVFSGSANESHIVPPVYAESGKTILRFSGSATEVLESPIIYNESAKAEFYVSGSASENSWLDMTLSGPSVLVVNPNEDTHHVITIPDAPPFNTPNFTYFYAIYRYFNPSAAWPGGPITMPGWTKATSVVGPDGDELAIFYRETPIPPGTSTIGGVAQNWPILVGLWAIERDGSGPSVTPRVAAAATYKGSGAGTQLPSVSPTMHPRMSVGIWAGTMDDFSTPYTMTGRTMGPDYLTWWTDGGKYTGQVIGMATAHEGPHIQPYTELNPAQGFSSGSIRPSNMLIAKVTMYNGRG